MAKRKRGKRKKNKTHVPVDYNKKVPKSMVIKRGKVGQAVSQLVEDLKFVMRPFTMASLKQKKTNKLKDFIHVTQPLGITHMLLLTQSDNFNTILRVGNVPHGPTLHFRVKQFALRKTITSHQKRKTNTQHIYQTAPLVVLNDFQMDKKPHHKLIAAAFQNIFPPINVAEVKFGDCRRVLLLNYDKDEDIIQFRHYAITVGTAGLSKNIRRLVKSRIPNLKNANDISDYMSGYGIGGDISSDSEYDDESAHVMMPSQPQSSARKSAVKLIEIGPRMDLHLLKVERELCAGEVVYHSYVKKSTESIEETSRRHSEAKALKKQRREKQDENVLIKKQKLEEKKMAKEQRRKLREASRGNNIEQGKSDE